MHASHLSHYTRLVGRSLLVLFVLARVEVVATGGTRVVLRGRTIDRDSERVSTEKACADQ